MYELVQAGACSYYFNSPAKIGLYLAQDKQAYLIDSGNDKNAGRKVLQVLTQKGWTLQAIVNTHSNADHIGGNHFLQQRTGCRVFANGIEADFTRHPILEPSFLYGGYPCHDLRHKFLLAEESEVIDSSDPAFPAALQPIPLPGHFFDMIGLRTPDGTVFLADCLSSAQTLEKYGIPFIYDVQAYLDTLEKVGQMQAPMFVPAHAPATADIRPLTALNREKVLAVADAIRAICAQPLCFEEILQRLFTAYGLQMDFAQYVLVGSTVRSYLSWMKDQGQLEALFADSRLLWKSVQR